MLPIPESAALVAMNPYALSKKLAEEACKFYADIYGVKIIILRPFNVYGSGQSDRFLIPYLINQVKSKTTISIQDIEPRRDFIYIDDLVDAIIKAMEIQLDFDIFNIGSGVSYSVAELIGIIQKIQGTSLGIKVDGERRIGEVMDTQADITKAFDILGWSPKYSLHSGLEKMLVTAS
jgi:nucleoside-diphosphate-sugar epimerase